MAMEPTSIILKHGGLVCTIENLPWDINSGELLENFQRLMVAAGFPPTVLDTEGGYWDWRERE